MNPALKIDELKTERIAWRQDDFHMLAAYEIVAVSIKANVGGGIAPHDNVVELRNRELVYLVGARAAQVSNQNALHVWLSLAKTVCLTVAPSVPPALDPLASALAWHGVCTFVRC